MYIIVVIETLPFTVGGGIKLADQKKMCIQQSRTSRNRTQLRAQGAGFIIQVMQAISHFICPFPLFFSMTRCKSGPLHDTQSFQPITPYNTLLSSNLLASGQNE